MQIYVWEIVPYIIDVEEELQYMWESENKELTMVHYRHPHKLKPS